MMILPYVEPVHSFAAHIEQTDIDVQVRRERCNSRSGDCRYDEHAWTKVDIRTAARHRMS